METTKKRGGYRPNSGRKKIEKREKQVSYWISNAAAEKLAKYAEVNGISLNEAITRILEGLP